MSLGLSRALLRRQVLRHNQTALSIAYRRSASTAASEAANSAKQGASDAAKIAKEKLGPAASKAQEGLTKVASSAGNALGAAGRALGSIGGRTGRIIGAVQGLVPHVVYYSRVALELGKIVAEKRGFNPPSSDVFQKYWSQALKYVRNPSAIESTVKSATPSSAAEAQNVLSSIRNADRQQLTTAGIVAAEVLGFFTVGEMIGRLKIVGYRGVSPAESHAH